MQVLPAKKQDRSSTRMYSKRVRSQSEKHLAIPCKHRSYSFIPYSLTRTLFPVESTDNIKTKVTTHRVIGGGCMWEGISLFHQALNAVSDGMFKRK